MKNVFYALISFCVLTLMFSCKNSELEQEMSDYCACIDKYKYDAEGRLECIEYIETLQKKYENDPRKKAKMIELSSDCN